MRGVFLLIVLSLLALGGCAIVPAPIAGKDFTAVTPQQAAMQNARGTRVRWGGEIIRVDPKADTTCFEVLSRDLYSDARPNRRDGSDGRFIACGKGFYDPAVYAKGRDLTVTGQLDGTERRPVGEHEYTYARVDAEGIYLWPKRVRAPYYDPFYCDPLWGPCWGPYMWGSPGYGFRARAW
ncbi:MAG TPA: Slp family lipoprotein [Rudaea sp.]|jgi:outer membrane lipoprotein|nr:Slp family lipoprotein [Rudaea sp.]